MSTVQTYPLRPLEFYKNQQLPDGTPNLAIAGFDPNPGLYVTGRAPVNLFKNKDGDYEIKGLLTGPHVTGSGRSITSTPLVLRYNDASNAGNNATIATESGSPALNVTRRGNGEVEFSYTWSPGGTEIELGDYISVQFELDVCGQTQAMDIKTSYLMTETMGGDATYVTPTCVVNIDTCGLETCDWTCDTAMLLLYENIGDEDPGYVPLGGFNGDKYVPFSEGGELLGTAIPSEGFDNVRVTIDTNAASAVFQQPLSCSYFQDNLVLMVPDGAGGSKMYAYDSACNACKEIVDGGFTYALSVTGDPATQTLEQGASGDSGLDFVVTSSLTPYLNIATISVADENGDPIVDGITVTLDDQSNPSASGSDVERSVPVEVAVGESVPAGEYTLVVTFFFGNKSVTGTIALTVTGA